MRDPGFVDVESFQIRSSNIVAGATGPMRTSTRCSWIG